MMGEGKGRSITSRWSARLDAGIVYGAGYRGSPELRHDLFREQAHGAGDVLVRDTADAGPSEEVPDSGVAEHRDLLGDALDVVEDEDVLGPVVVVVAGPVVLTVGVQLVAGEGRAVGRRDEL